MAAAFAKPLRLLRHLYVIPLALSLAATSRAQITDLPPEIAAPDTVSGIEQSTMTFQATASDPEGDPIYQFQALGLPAGATFVTNATMTEGTFTWTPGPTSASNLTVQLSAISARRPTEVSGTVGQPQATTKNVYLRIANLDRPPTLDVPDHVSGAQHVLFGFAVQAEDPDQDPVTVTMTDVPAGATVSSFGPTATFSWSPDQAGEYAVTIHANSTTYEARDTVSISVRANQRPIVDAPALVPGRETEPLEFQVSASDPDGDEIVSLWIPNLPGGASFTAGETAQTGTFRWTPDYSAAGSHFITISARSAVRAEPVSGPIIGYSEASFVTEVSIENVDRPPVLQAIPSQTVYEGAVVRKEFGCNDPDIRESSEIVLSLYAPDFVRLEQGRFSSWFTIGTLILEPGYDDAGVYTGNRIRAQSGELFAETTFDILVRENSPPRADPGGPYSGTIDVPIQFDGTGSSDPDGASLTYLWGFGDWTWAMGPTTTHTYHAAGTFTVTLTVDDGATPRSASTTATVHDVLGAVAFLDGGDRMIRLQSGKPTMCVQLEAVNGSFVS